MNYLSLRPYPIGFLIIGVVYNLFFYTEDVKMEKMTPKSYRVKEQYCRVSKRSSSIFISHNSKNYSIRMSNNDCLNYPVGSNIKLVYNDRYDYFYKQDGLQKGIFKIFFSLFFYVFQ